MGLLRRLRSESGAALVTSLGVLVTLGISVTTVIASGTSNMTHASRTNRDQQAYALAEAGLGDAFAVLSSAYSLPVVYPGDANLLPARTTNLQGGTVTWSGQLVATTSGAWQHEWRIQSVGTATSNPAAPHPVGQTRTLTAVVPVVLPPTQASASLTPLNWIYANTDLTFGQSVRVASPVFALRDLTLTSSATIAGAAKKIAVGRNLSLTSPQGKVGLLDAADPRIAEAHVVGLCASKSNSTLHDCGGSPTATSWDADNVFATTTNHTVSGLVQTPSLTCCAPVSGAIAPAAFGSTSDMGFWYGNADLGPKAPCDAASRTGIPPTFDTADNTINGSATPSAAVNLTPFGASYTCRSTRNGETRGELSWNATTKALTVKGTIFIDGSAKIDSAGYSGSPVFTYTGQATLIVSGTFMMKSTKLCAIAGSSECTWGSAWDPNSRALVVVADGDGAAGSVQAQGNVVEAGYGIEIVTGSSFQGGLMANKSIKTEQTAGEQGPMVSVYNGVTSGQTNTLTFPAINFAPTAAQSIASGTLPTAVLMKPQSFAG